VAGKPQETILLLDDELGSVMWMMDYLYDKGFLVDTCSNANDAFELVGNNKYRAAIIDLNVPLLEPLHAMARDLGEVYLKFPGLLIAREARSKGHRDRQIIIYTVHREPEVREIADRLRCTYIIKGRPAEIKQELEEVFAFDPSARPERRA
jgi:CheY-like chemotaxis protein